MKEIKKISKRNVTLNKQIRKDYNKAVVKNFVDDFYAKHGKLMSKLANE